MIRRGSVELSLVVPVHHCAGDFGPTVHALARFLDSAPVTTELVLVNDRGSDPAAATQLRLLSRRPDVRLLENARNEGKGYSVRRGMLAAVGRHRVFTDADLAYPLPEVWKISDALERGADVAIACRALDESRYEVASPFLPYFYTRHLLSRSFNRLVRATLLPGILDTQAGLKGFTAAAARDVFPQVRIAGFGFDLECLYVARCRNLSMEQVAVRYRCDDEPTTVRFARDGRRMLGDLARIRWRALTGQYLLEGSTAHADIADDSDNTDRLLDGIGVAARIAS